MAKDKKRNKKPQNNASGFHMPDVSLGLYSYNGNTLIDTEDYNEVLQNRDLPPVPERRYGGEGGLLLTIGRLFFDMSGEGRGGQMQRGAYITSFGYGHGEFNIGYVWKKNRLFRFYPMLGVGGAGSAIHTEKKEGIGDERNLEPLRTEVNAVLQHIGLGLDFTPRLGPIRFFLGIRAGYAHPRYTTPPATPHRDRVKVGGFYLRFIWGIAFQR
ncbi:MAG: hypothetical protein D6712_11685 [Chloroflexi bacterium]|nr:MAG: hypothetical protein D6712_11685 [Chloroflexota bacterium]